MLSLAIPLDWSDHGPSFKLDVMSLMIAVALHLPLYFMKFDTTKKSFDRPTNRLIAIDLIDPTIPAPPPPPIVPEVHKSSLMERLQQLVKRTPPPPPPPPKKVEPKIPEKLDTGPKEIKLEAKLKLPDPAQAKLAGKAGFKTTADPKLIEEKQIAIKTFGGGTAPLSEKQLGAVKDRAKIKNDRGDFKVARADTLRSIGGNEGGLADPTAPAIAIRTGSKGSVEKFSAPPPQQKSNKGKMGAVGLTELGGGSAQVGLRDYVIARDAPAGTIDLSKKGGTLAGVPGGVPGGVEGGQLGGKKDSGHFQGGAAGGVVGGTGRDVGTIPEARPIVPTAKPKPKRSMFTITGPLSNRQILSQVLPEYPAWAISQGIEASVILQFTVEPSGLVKDAIVVRRTSGYDQLDKEAMKALRRWKFVPLQEGENRDEVGQITFNFSLS